MSFLTSKTSNDQNVPPLLKMLMTKIPEVDFSSNASVTFDDIMENSKSNSCDMNSSGKMTSFTIAAIMNRLERPAALERTKLGKKQ